MLLQTKQLKDALKRHQITYLGKPPRCRTDYKNGGYGRAYAFVYLTDNQQKLLQLDSDLHIDPMYLNHKINKPMTDGRYFTKVES